MTFIVFLVGIGYILFHSWPILLIVFFIIMCARECKNEQNDEDSINVRKHYIYDDYYEKRRRYDDENEDDDYAATYFFRSKGEDSDEDVNKGRGSYDDDSLDDYYDRLMDDPYSLDPDTLLSEDPEAYEEIYGDE